MNDAGRTAGLTLLVAALTWGCGGIEDLDPSGQQVLFWHQLTHERERVLLDMIEEFNDANPDAIQVRGEYAGTYAAVYDRMLEDEHASPGPQLVVAYQNQAREYYRAGRIVDLRPYMESPRWGLSREDRADLVETLLDRDHAEGLQVAMRPHFSIELLYYNEDWLEELGLSAPPQTWAELAEMCRLARDFPFSRSVASEPSLGLVFDEDASRLASMVFSRGGHLINSWHRAYTLNTATMKSSLTMLRELKRDGAMALMTDGAAARQAFCSGRSLFMTASSSQIRRVEALIAAGPEFAWNVEILPREGDVPPIVNVYGSSLSVCTSTEAAQLAAWLFIKWFTAPSQQRHWVEGSSYFPVRASAASALEPFFANVFRLMEAGRSEPPVAGYERVRRMMVESMATALAGANLEQTLSMLEERANRTLPR